MNRNKASSMNKRVRIPYTRLFHLYSLTLKGEPPLEVRHLLSSIWALWSTNN